MSRDERVQRRFYERTAGRYDRKFLRSTWPRNQEVKARFVLDELRGARTVLEVGSGTGQIAAELLARDGSLEYVGVDLSSAMLDVARARLAVYGARATLRESSAASIPAGDGSFDAAFGVDVLHHVEDREAVLRELRRVVRPGGRVVFLEGNPIFPITLALALALREERGLLSISRRALAADFAAAGLVDIRADFAPLYTPPGPPRLVPAFDAVDHALARVPLVRALALFVRVRGSIPKSSEFGSSR
jgi:SAM-dependent methyltransferase